jgi:uncharacterized protein YndB with AHSA1/START domain
VLTRVFDAPLQEVWNAWSQPEYVMQWWGPQGFTCPLARMDFREGGTSLVCMRAPAEFGGQDLYNTWTYSRIAPMQSIEFIQNFADQDGKPIAPASVGLPPDIPYAVPHMLTFRAVGDNRTELTVIEMGYALEQTVEMSRAGMEQCLDKMTVSLARA